jgi:SsrA-binding protein
MAAKEKTGNNTVIKNRRASFDYAFVETFEAGIVLTGTEIKSVRLGKAGLADTYCVVERGEVWVKNMYIAEYFYGTYNNHPVRRERKLLLNKKEIRKLEASSKNSGFTVVPVKLFINTKGLAKLVIAVAKGKKEYDKRQALRERDDRRAIQSIFRKQ